MWWGLSGSEVRKHSGFLHKLMHRSELSGTLETFRGERRSRLRVRQGQGDPPGENPGRGEVLLGAFFLRIGKASPRPDDDLSTLDQVGRLPLVPMEDCLACALTSGERPLPGGLIFRTGHWLVEHCVGPLGLGTLVVKPERHVCAVADLTGYESAELGPLLQRSSRVAAMLVPADQVYNCLWSHAGGAPVHIHYVVQPVTKEQMARFGAHGPYLQTAMFALGQVPEPHEVEHVSDQARTLFGAA